MKGVDRMPTKITPWAKAIAVVALGFCLASCANNSSTVPEAEYSTKIVGRWQVTAGDLKETMSIDGDGTFVHCKYSFSKCDQNDSRNMEHRRRKDYSENHWNC